MYKSWKLKEKEKGKSEKSLKLKQKKVLNQMKKSFKLNQKFLF